MYFSTDYFTSILGETFIYYIIGINLLAFTLITAVITFFLGIDEKDDIKIDEK